MTRILFVCLGNICRSPTAEGVMRRLVREEGLEGEIEIDSAGTGGWHVGAPPDARATEAAGRRGTTLTGSARRFDPAADFDRFDLILAMDAENRRDLLALAPDEGARAKVRMFLPGDRDVPDPYYGGDAGFESVLDLAEGAARELLDEIRP
ncbi:MAG: low molecular weight protein-tyrosine phosphatase [Thermoleophilaceae bacterium]|nr:low molecular weight protein-tyrosine phosphatase [Thermoleophilaceae bacterium]